MDNFHRLSDTAKQAWQRGYDLAHPRHMPARPRKNPKYGEGAREAEMARAVDTVGAALENLAGSERKSFMAVKSGVGVNLVVMDPVSVEAVIAELDNMSTDECRKALGDGFLKGMIAKAKADQGAADGGAQGSTPTIN
ncbi:MAG: hypothetical protein O7F14_09210 [Alphaproteobacteria bacterium]|nr:hypothetical protein [Alphaproteobacteria bacterium]